MYIKIKRLLDVVGAVILLILLFPLMGIASLLIKLENPKAPFLFKQERPGKDEKLFTVYKFRTMCEERVDKEGRQLNDIERITRIGNLLRKTSIDELPQLINILRGDMSFIGPRPLLRDYLNIYTERERKRHLVRPGISGLAQVNGRNQVQWKKRLELDVYYVEHLSFKMDVTITFKTIKCILTRKGVNQSETVVMSYYRGEEEMK